MSDHCVQLCPRCMWAMSGGVCVMCPPPITDYDAGDEDAGQHKEGAD